MAVPDRPFLVDPLAGYPLVAEPVSASELQAADRRLREEGETGAAGATAAELLARDPGFHPATVLEAQLLFIAGDRRAAVERLAPVVAELPEYLAAQLLSGRAAELDGDLITAYRSYRPVRELSPVAADRLQELEPRVLEIAFNRVQDLLLRGRVEEATASFTEVEEWAPEATSTLVLARDLAVARDDLEGELEITRQLFERHPEESFLELRIAELEVEVGDPGTGMRLLRGLVERFPDDPQVREGLEKAKFRWRTSLLPSKVRELINLPQLDRGQYAVLLYWLLPDVRYSEVAAGRIASDILDHTAREEIARVVNLQLMRVDEALHRFSPYRPVSRGEAMASLLRALDRRPQRPGCLGSATLGTDISLTRTCRIANRCRLLATESDCLPRGPLGGREAQALIRRALGLMEPP